MKLLALLQIRLVNRMNTRRNRARAVRRFFNRQDEAWLKAAPPIPESERDANWIRSAAHLAFNRERGVTLKCYSAWAGCKVRTLSKLLDDYAHRRLPGQNQIH